MTTTSLSLCRWPWHRSGARVLARRGSIGRARVARAAALSIAISCAAFAQSTDRAASTGVRLDAVLERVVQATGSGGAPRYELAPGVVGAGGEQFVLTLRFTNTTNTTVDT